MSCELYEFTRLLKGAWVGGWTANYAEARVCGFHLWFWSIPSSRYLISHPDEIIFLLVLHCFDGVLEPTDTCCDWRVDFLLKSHDVAPGFILTVKIYLLTDWYIWDERFCITKRTVYIWGVFSNVSYFCRKIKKILLLVNYGHMIGSNYWRQMKVQRHSCRHRCVFDVLQQVLEERLSITPLRTSQQTAGRGFRSRHTFLKQARIVIWNPKIFIS